MSYAKSHAARETQRIADTRRRIRRAMAARCRAWLARFTGAQ